MRRNNNHTLCTLCIGILLGLLPMVENIQFVSSDDLFVKSTSVIVVHDFCVTEYLN